MATPLYNKGFKGWAQLGIFLGLWGIGMVVGSIAALAVWVGLTGQGVMNMQQDMFNPAYAGALKVLQAITTLFMFMAPAVAYAFICYKPAGLALGFTKRPAGKLIAIAVAILLVSMPVVDGLSLINKAIPLAAEKKKLFDGLEKSYEDQVKVIGNVKTTGQYLLSLFMIAMLPAVFEEVLFRGGIQNMLTRWKNNSVLYLIITAILLMVVYHIWWAPFINAWVFYGILLALTALAIRSTQFTGRLDILTNSYWFPIIYTSVIFSAIHGSWYGFLPRLGLGIMLGLVFFYTKNLWYGIILHFLNNGTVVTLMYISALQKKGTEASLEQSTSLPWWAGLLALPLLVFLFRLLSASRQEEAPAEVFLDRSNPFAGSDMPVGQQ